jgi:hypothetical protein
LSRKEQRPIETVDDSAGGYRGVRPGRDHIALPIDAPPQRAAYKYAACRCAGRYDASAHHAAYRASNADSVAHTAATANLRAADGYRASDWFTDNYPDSDS